MYSGELEVQAKRKAIAVLQDEINRILNAARELATLPDLMMRKDRAGIKNSLEQISTIEEEVESLRRKITREVADVGGLIMNRENLLNTAYTMDEIAGYITGISFKLSNVKPATLKSAHLDKDVTNLIELVVDEVYKLNEIIRSPEHQHGKRHRACPGDADDRAGDRHQVPPGDAQTPDRRVRHEGADADEGRDRGNRGDGRQVPKGV